MSTFSRGIHPLRGHPRGRGRIALLLILVMVAVASTMASPAAADPLDKVEKKVLEQSARAKQVTFWAVLRDQADLGRAYRIKDRDARGSFVSDNLRRSADKSQAGLRDLLTKRGVRHQAFWITNTVKITAGEAVLKEVAAHPSVARILADRTYQIPKPTESKQQPGVNAVEWNIDRVRAPQVWSTFGMRGEGIVVASVDTGVQFDHPALVGQYRGNQGGGNFAHDYNWFDPSATCGDPTSAPCDRAGHGTHTMGTMVGDDGGPEANQIGVAPGARWIAAKGCEDFGCSLSSLLAAGQWILAPTDRTGQNPRPDLRPHVVNNSWGGSGDDPFYQAIVDSWLASGIFPAFANGNSGPYCNSSGSPGDYVNTYSAGAFDIDNAIADFSSRGPSGSEPKPNIAAPGVAVRSSVPGGSYDTFDGTSMAAPHVAATVALIWSVAPALTGDVTGTRAVLDDSAVDVSDLSCGGSEDDNNVWGEGRLDAFAAVDRSPRGPVGIATGTVTDADGGAPVGGATIQVAGAIDRTTTTDPDGRYTMTLPVGTYEITATAFGFQPHTQPGLTISEGATTVADLALRPVPSYVVSGRVRTSGGEAVPNATVTLLGTPLPPATTDADGGYRFAKVPQGEYEVRAGAGRCSEDQERSLVVDGDETLDFTLPPRADDHGHFCQISTPGYVEADTVLPLSGDDASTQVDLPFPVSFYGQTYDTAHVSTNGFLSFLGPNSAYFNTPIPHAETPNAAIYAYWDDLFVDGEASVRTAASGSAPARTFVVEWRNVAFLDDPSRRLDFEIVLHEDGRIRFEYRNIDDNPREKGGSATIGIENESGSIALQYSFDEAALASPAFALIYGLLPGGFAQGTVTDGNDRRPLAGATVRALRDGSVVRSTTTDEAGRYRMRLGLGTYRIEATAENYSTESAEVVLDEPDETATRDFAMRAARAGVAPGSLELVVPPGQSRTRTLTLENTGSLDLTWQLAEAGGGAVTTSSTTGLAKNPGYDPSAPTTRGRYAGGKAPSGWAPTAPGDVVRSWSPGELNLAWGVGYTGNVWLGDVLESQRSHEFSTTGAPTGRVWPAPPGGEWNADLAYDAARGLMCQVKVGGDNGIHCWDPDTGAVTDSITGSFPWTAVSQRGLAYRADGDTFFVGGWNDGVLYQVKGLSHPDKGAVVSQCRPPDGNISGLAWNENSEAVWAATNSETDTIYQLDPETCGVLGTLSHPSPGYNGAGLDLDEEGNLWMMSQSPNRVYLVESGVPNQTDVPWLSEEPTSGTLAPGATQNIRVTVDTTGLAPGTYSAVITIRTNSPGQDRIQVPVRLVVPRYHQGVNAGGAGYTDRSGDLWSADQRYRAGGWGYTNSRASDVSTRRPISGTDEDPLYQDLRQDPVEYRFDGLPEGVYEVDLRFAELTNRRPNSRLYDVIAEGAFLLPAHDIAGEVGTFAADQHVFYVRVTDGQLNLRFVERTGFSQPVVNGIQVVHRPDR